MSDITRHDFNRWIRTGNVPRRVDFGPAFQDDWRYLPEMDHWTRLYRSRDTAIREFGFALPCREAVKALKKLSPIVEVGAGSGAWSRLLASSGVDVVATDQGFETGYWFRSGKHFPVARIEASDAIRRYPRRNVLMIWPCYGAEWSANAVRLIRPGQSLALISEGPGGCVGSDSLFDHLDTHFRHIETVRIPCWQGIHDRLEIYRRLAAGRNFDAMNDDDR